MIDDAAPDEVEVTARHVEARVDMMTRRVLTLAGFNSDDKHVCNELRALRKRRQIVISA